MKKIYGFFTAALLAAALTACSTNDGTGTTETPAAVSAEQSADPESESDVTDVTEETSASVCETAAASVCETAAASAETAAEFTRREVPFEDTAHNAYERLTVSFETAEGVVIPDDYAGVYSYFGKLYVCVTEKDVPESYTELLKDYTCVSFVWVHHSLNELTRVGEEAEKCLRDDFGAKEHYVDIPSNMAVVSISKGDPKSAQNYLKTLTQLPFSLDELTIVMAEEEETLNSD